MMQSTVCALALFVVACSAGAQSRPDYPKRPVRFIVAQTPGGNADFVGRIIAEALGKRLGQQFVVDNRPGASGIIASEIIMKAPPDGYTLLLVTTSFGVNPALYKKLPYDSLSDLVPITHIAYAPQILMVAIVQQPDLRKQLSAEGGEPVGNTPEEFARWLKAEIAKWTKVVREANIRPE